MNKIFSRQLWIRGKSKQQRNHARNSLDSRSNWRSEEEIIWEGNERLETKRIQPNRIKEKMNLKKKLTGESQTRNRIAWKTPWEFPFLHNFKPKESIWLWILLTQLLQADFFWKKSKNWWEQEEILEGRAEFFKELLNPSRNNEKQ